MRKLIRTNNLTPQASLMGRRGALGGAVVIICLLGVWLLGSNALAGVRSGAVQPRDRKEVETAALRGERGAWFQAYFSKPASSPDLITGAQGMDAALVADIAQATHSIRVASFDLDLLSITNALVAAHGRGVTVRVSVDGENLAAPEASFAMGRLEDAGIMVFYDRRSAFMHDKIVVLDEHVVWTGSWNLTANDTFRNNNNMLRIDNAQLAAEYRAKLDVIGAGHGGPNGRGVVHSHSRVIGAATVQAMFAPEDSIIDMLVQQIDRAQRRVDVLAFAFTSDAVAHALMRAHERGVAVRVVMERRNTGGTGSEFAMLRAAGIDIHADGNCFVMHHKVIMVDGQRMITGSFNFTDAAQQQNDENVLLIHDADVTSVYGAEFERVYNQALNPATCEK